MRHWTDAVLTEAAGEGFRNADAAMGELIFWINRRDLAKMTRGRREFTEIADGEANIPRGGMRAFVKAIGVWARKRGLRARFKGAARSFKKGVPMIYELDTPKFRSTLTVELEGTTTASVVIQAKPVRQPTKPSEKVHRGGGYTYGKGEVGSILKSWGSL